MANALLLAFTAYLSVEIARISWLWIWPGTVVPELYGHGQRSNELGNGNSATSVAGYHFFGRSAMPEPVAENVRRSAPETNLRLTLEGVLVAAHPANSGAIVAGGNSETAYYRVGEMLPGNAELVEVEPDKILLLRHGQYETLVFEKKVDSDTLLEREVERPARSPDALLAKARSQLESQGAQALAAYGLRPASGSGESGYVYDGSNPMLNAVSLREGDVITAINGHQLGDIKQDKTLLTNWRSSPRLDIEIERNGTILSVSYAIPEQWR